jgi:hypothetical protein
MNIKIPQGDSRTFTVYYIKNRVAVPLVDGDTVYFTVKSSIKSTTELISKAVTSFTEDGKALVEISSSDTANLADGKYVYDVRIATVHNEVFTIIPPSIFEITEVVKTLGG